MSAARRFIDTNVVVYAYDSDEPAKQPVAQPVEQPVAQKLLKQAVLDEDGVNGTTALSS